VQQGSDRSDLKERRRCIEWRPLLNSRAAISGGLVLPACAQSRTLHAMPRRSAAP
jgi:hypothetical protein